MARTKTQTTPSRKAASHKAASLSSASLPSASLSKAAPLSKAASLSKPASLPPAPLSKAVPFPPAPSPPSAEPGFFGNLFQGMALGTGSSMGHRAVEYVLGSKHHPSASVSTSALAHHTTPCPQESCERMLDTYNNCMNHAQPQCQPWYDAYTECLAKLHAAPPCASSR